MGHAGRARAALMVLAVLTLVVATGCGGSDGGGAGGGSSPPPAGGADITGVISQVSAGPGRDQGSFLIVADPVVTSAVDRAMVRVTADTVIWAPEGEGRRSLVFGDLRADARVAVRFTGPVAESYPVQVTAADVEVLSGP
jgi:hypothetical protein